MKICGRMEWNNQNETLTKTKNGISRFISRFHKAKKQVLGRHINRNYPHRNTKSKNRRKKKEHPRTVGQYKMF